MDYRETAYRGSVERLVDDLQIRERKGYKNNIPKRVMRVMEHVLISASPLASSSWYLTSSIVRQPLSMVTMPYSSVGN